MNRVAPISFVLFAVTASPALACSPVEFPVGQVSRSDDCGVTYYDDGITGRGVDGATDLGSGFVEQFYVSGNACYASSSMIVTDCNSGRAVIFGPVDIESPMSAAAQDANRPFNTLRRTIETAAQAGEPLSLERIHALAGTGYVNNSIVDAGNPVAISNTTDRPLHSFDLSCGCRHFYPGVSGG